jgi:mannan endo-1,4-beta-mannosidase
LVDHHAKGGIVQLQWHWPNPLTGGSDFPDTQILLTDAEWEAIVTPGTPEYEVLIEDLDYHADYVKTYLTDRNIPVLWRPLHEIDGGWFWWTCRSDGTKTAELWRIVFKRLVNHHGLHNLIWVYSAGIETPGGDEPNTPYRNATYPGPEYVDIVGIDLYEWDLQRGTHDFWDWTATYRDMFDIMAAVAPGKMIALTEAQAMPDPAKSFGGDAAFAPWLWALPWWGIRNDNTCERINTTYNNPNVINLDDLPSFR